MDKYNKCAFQLIQDYATAIQFLSNHMVNSQTREAQEYISTAIHNIANAIELDCGSFKDGTHLPKNQ